MSQYDDFEELERPSMSLEQIEDEGYKPQKDWFGRDNTIYPYSKAIDFNKLTPAQIVTRRLNIIKPDIETGSSIVKKDLNEDQRKALLRLMAIKSNVEKLPRDKQEKMRASLIQDYEKSKPDQEAIEMLLDEARLLINEENRSKEDDEKLWQRYQKLTGVLSETQLLDRLEKLIDKPLPPRLQRRREELKSRKSGGRKRSRKMKRTAGKKKTIRKRSIKTKRKSLKNMTFYRNLQRKRSMAVSYD